MWASILEAGIGRGSDAWTAREAFLSRGPAFALDQIVTTLLLVHGGRDTAAASVARWFERHLAGPPP